MCVHTDGSSSRGNRAAAAAAGKRSAAAAAGAVGLSFEKMQLVRQKKEEIEKVSYATTHFASFCYFLKQTFSTSW